VEEEGRICAPEGKFIQTFQIFYQPNFTEGRATNGEVRELLERYKVK
jgi:hypothetical protein